MHTYVRKEMHTHTGTQMCGTLIYTRLVVEKMSLRREDVYLAGTDLMAWRGCWSFLPLPWCCVHVSLCVCATVVCVAVDWSKTTEMPACCAPLDQAHIASDTAKPAVWQACDREELVRNDLFGSITLPKCWTRHLPLHGQRLFCYSQMDRWLQPICSRYRLIIHRCQQCTSTDKICYWETEDRSKSAALSARSGPRQWWLSWRKHQSLVFTLPLYPLMFWYSCSPESKSICQTLLWEEGVKVTEVISQLVN